MRKFIIDYNPEEKTILRLTMNIVNPKKYASATSEQAKEMLECIDRFEAGLSGIKKELAVKANQ